MQTSEKDDKSNNTNSGTESDADVEDNTEVIMFILLI